MIPRSCHCHKYYDINLYYSMVSNSNPSYRRTKLMKIQDEARYLNGQSSSKLVHGLNLNFAIDIPTNLMRLKCSSRVQMICCVAFYPRSQKTFSSFLKVPINDNNTIERTQLIQTSDLHANASYKNMFDLLCTVFLPQPFHRICTALTRFDKPKHIAKVLNYSVSPLTNLVITFQLLGQNPLSLFLNTPTQKSSPLNSL